MSMSRDMADYLKRAISYMREGIYTIYSIAKGHVVTFVNLFRPKVTLQYPEVRWDLPEGYRGFPTLPVDPDTGQDLCIGCGACARICPTQLITVETHLGEDKKRVVDGFYMKAGLCMFCQLCVEVCPTDALVMSDNYELASFSRDSLTFDRDKLNELGGEREPKPKPEKPDSEGSECGEEAA